MHPGVIVTSSIVERILDVEEANILSRLEPLAEVPGNPWGVHILRRGRAVAFAAEGIDWPLYNSVLGVEQATLQHLDEIEAFYADHDGAGLLEIVPGRLTVEMGHALAARGYAMTEFHAGLVRGICPEDAELEPVPGVEVVRIDPAGGFDLWVDTFQEGWSADPTPKAALQTWRDNPTWRFYVARVDGEPAGAAVLDVRGPTAMNASASTRPAFRGRRAQSALIRARIRDAARLGCDLLVGGAYFGITSMRNHQREGFGTAFTRGIWTPPPREATDPTCP